MAITVIGTQNLITFCENFNKELIQISTISVSGNTYTNLENFTFSSDDEIQFDETSLFIEQSLDNVYVRSKFEAEKLILEEFASKKLKGLILRVGNITNRYLDGKFQINPEENAFMNRLKAFLTLGYLPISMKNKYVEFTPVDSVANAIVRSIQYYNNCITVLHLYNSNHLYIDKFISILDNIYSSNKIKFTQDDEFKKIIKNSFYDKQLSEFTNILANDLDKNNNLNYKANLKIKNDLTLNFLNLIRFKWPEIDEEYIKKIFKK